jgi:hypothetical protein
MHRYGTKTVPVGAIIDVNKRLPKLRAITIEHHFPAISCCHKCVYNSYGLNCNKVKCKPDSRTDNKQVFFMEM